VGIYWGGGGEGIKRGGERKNWDGERGKKINVVGKALHIKIEGAEHQGVEEGQKEKGGQRKIQRAKMENRGE